MQGTTPPSSLDSIISIVLPVYNEAENIQPCLRQLYAALKDTPHEILVCYDFDGDTTLPAIEAMANPPPTLRLVKNELGRGVAYAMQAGFAAARGDVIVTTMADLSDPPDRIPLMAEKVRQGAAVVSGSRYMPGGSQHGGPLLKRTLSRLAGLSLHYVAGVGTHDATTNFRAYSAEFLRSIRVQSRAGFELALEMTVKAHLAGEKVDEVPSTWHDRSAGQSRFKLWRWMPRYLRWFSRAMAVPAVVWGVLFALLVAGYVSAATATASVAEAATQRFATVLLAMVATALILAARRVRRRMSLTDLLFPLGAFAIGLSHWLIHYRLLVAAVLFVLGLCTVVMQSRPPSRRWTGERVMSGPLHPAWILAWIIGLPLVAFTLIPWLPRIIATEALDPSWQLALNEIFVAGFIFGDQIIFTFGPLGILYGNVYHPETHAFLVMGWVFLATAIFLGVWRLAFASIINPWLGACGMVVMLALIANAPKDVLLVSPTLLFILLHFRDSSRGSLVAATLLPAAMAAVSLCKLSLFVGAVCVIFLSAIDDLMRRRFPWQAVVYVTSIAGLWLVVGQPLKAFPTFVTTSLEISSGYTEAMSLDHPVHPYRGPLLYVAGTVLLLGVIAWVEARRNHWRGGAALLGLAGLLFLLFKAGFVRHDRHELIATGALLVFAVFIAIAYQRLITTWTERSALAMVITVALLTHVLGHAASDSSLLQGTAQHVRTIPTRMADAKRLASGQSNLHARYEQAMKAIRQSRPIPIVEGTVDLYPHNQAVILAHGLSYQPRPIFQSYAAYTGSLAARNAAYLRQFDAPEHILFDIESIDGRLPAMDDGLSWPELLTRYDIVDTAGTFLHLRRAPEPRTHAMRHIATTSAGFYEVIELPLNMAGPIWATIRFAPAPARKALSFLYKPSEIHLNHRLADGREVVLRMIPSVAEAGFLLSPLVTDRDGFLVLAAGRTDAADDERVVSIGLQIADGRSAITGGSATISFFELEFPPQDVVLPGRELQIMRSNLLYAETPIHVVPGGPGGRRILGAHPTSRMALPVPPDASSIKVGFGIRTAAWDRGPDATDGVEFRIHRMNADGSSELIWSRYLDPVRRSQDRDVQHIELDFGGEVPQTLIFETLPGPTPVWDWAYWTDVGFVQRTSP